MTHSAIAIPPALTNQIAIRYGRDGAALPHYDLDTTGASSIYASAEDMVRFGFLHVKALAPGQRAILRDTTIDLMQRRMPPSPFGIGWLVPDGKNAGVAFHGGGMDGVSTALFIVPEQHLVVVGLSSTMIDLPGRVAAEIVNRMTGRDVDFNRDPPIPQPPRGTMPVSLAGEWLGEVLAYNGPHAFALSIEPSGAIQARLDGGDRRPAEVVEWIGEELHGSIVADLGVADVRQPYRLRFQLRLAAPNQLEGPLNAWSFRSGRGADIVPSFVRVRRTSTTP
jgi:CubicO group peptidase (beta-lactamase class C family)